jgi:hypothetical protein
MPKTKILENEIFYVTWVTLITLESKRVTRGACAKLIGSSCCSLPAFHTISIVVLFLTILQHDFLNLMSEKLILLLPCPYYTSYSQVKEKKSIPNSF